MVGISVDNPGQNKAMVEKPGLPFPAEAMTKVYDRFLAATAAHRHPVTTMAWRGVVSAQRRDHA